MQNKKIELLAPCGTIEAFHAALDGGADAVYLGLGNFNARQRQKNFTAQTLSYVIPYAQKKGVKVYITMNTLVKDGEIPLFINDCTILKQLKPDALIIQDWGMAAMLKKYFSEIPLHASTQMAIHNSMQVKFAQDFGISRVVPARELTLSEIRKIKNKTVCEIELFVHGALCYSISGRCLASSYLGGASGNRGHCTQACRRFYSETPQKKGFYFSPKDFWAIDFLEEYQNIGISSLKIEGRMKGAEYVYSVVSAYRDFIDEKIDLETAKERLSHDFGRQKCTFLLNGENSTAVVSAARQAGTGNYAGKIAGIDKRGIILESDGEIPQVGDRLRFHSVDGEEGGVVKVEEVIAEENSKLIRLIVDGDFKINSDGALFIISRKNPMIKQWKTRKIHVNPRKFDVKKGIPAGKIMSEIDRNINPNGKPHLFLRGDSVEWIKQFKSVKNANYILSVSKSTYEIDFTKEKLKGFVSQIIIALPQFIPQGDISFWKSAVENYKKNGISKFMISNLGDKEFFGKDDKIYADYPLWTINRYTQKMLEDYGFYGFSYSPEDDILNLKRNGNNDGLFCIFMKIPLFVSRIKPVLQDGKLVCDSMNERFFIKIKDNCSYLLSGDVLGLTHRVDKLSELGIKKFVLDFSFFPPGDTTLFRNVLTSYERRNRISGSVLFNHKGGLK
ncbi:MAG: U32 family peptidase [Chitinispirillales bacterium]|jgi:putative protease|nr:U32 family peptidase [Chitinispirillales bacterium]